MTDALTAAPIARKRIAIAASSSILAAFGAWAAWIYYEASERRETTAAIRAAGGVVTYDWQKSKEPFPLWKLWYAKVFGPDSMGNVVAVNLSYAQSGIDDGLMARIGRLRQIEALQIPANAVTETGLRNLRGIARLKDLRISQSGATYFRIGIPWTWRETFLDDPVEESMLIDGPISDGQLPQLSPFLMSAKVLFLRSDRLTDKGFSVLANSKELEILILDVPEVSSLAPIHNAARLKKLMVSQSQIDDNGLEPIANLSQLGHVSIQSNQITDAGLRHFGKLINLENLGLNGSRVTDRGLLCLTSWPRLRSLGLMDTSISDKGVVGLEDRTILPRCRSLILSGKNITEDARASLRAKRPEILILGPDLRLPNSAQE